jgi:hypothetical protein
VTPYISSKTVKTINERPKEMQVKVRAYLLSAIVIAVTPATIGLVPAGQKACSFSITHVLLKTVYF